MFDSKESWEWSRKLIDAKNMATNIPYGDIHEDHFDGIIAEAARLKGVDPPIKGSEDYDELLETIKGMAEQENDELKRGEVRL